MNQLILKIRFFCLIVVLCLSACGGLWLPKEVQLSQAQLQALIARKFPIKKTLSTFVINVEARLEHPIISIDAPHQRIQLATQVSVLTDTDSTVKKGQLVVSGQPYYDTARHALLLRSASIEQFEVESVPPGILPLLGGLWLKTMDEIELYVLNDEQIQRLGKTLDTATIVFSTDHILIKR